ncbi:MAG: DUF99 family protein [Candidatus Woesearchaeota archaeon]
MKKETRVIGIDDAPFNKKSKKDVLVIGAIFRGGSWFDGLLSTKVKVDGTDSTRKLISMINSSKFRPQLQCIFLDGIAVAGFNVIDTQKLHKATKLPVIVVIRRFPDYTSIRRALAIIRKPSRFKLMEQAGPVQKIGKVYCQLIGIDLKKARELLKLTCTRSHIPEPVRVAHMIASGITEGQSRGRA